MRGGRPGALVVLFVIAAAASAALPGMARAQDISCDQPGAREVNTLSFVGNRTFSSDDLSAWVATTPSTFTRRYFRWFFGAGAARCLPREGLGRDVQALKQFYRANGFYRTTVDTAVASLSPRTVAVTFRINEGPPMVLDTLRITGMDSVPNRAAILSQLRLEPGGRYGEVLLGADIDSITARLRNSGYPRAEVLRGAVNTHPDSNRASVELMVETGPRVRLGPVLVQGNSAHDGRPPEIPSAAVERLLGFGPGDWYSDRALAEGQRNLYNLGAYRHVGISLDSAAAPGDTVVPVVVDVREDFLHQFQQEEGWGQLDCFRASSAYTDRNFLNRALRLDLTGSVSKLGYGSPTNSSATKQLCDRAYLNADSIASSKLNYYAGAVIQQPTLFGGRWVPAFAVYTERRGEYKEYLRSTDLGLDASATRNIGLGMPLRLGYTLEFGRTQAEPAELCAVFLRCDQTTQQEVQNRLRFAVVSASLQRVRTDNVVDPSQGYVLGAEARAASPYIGSDTLLKFVKLTADASWFHPLARGTTLAIRLRGGFIPGSALAPLQERLYAGGATSVRGFQQNELGAHVSLLNFTDFTIDTLTRSPDTTVALVANKGASPFRTVPTGGNRLAVGNIELRIRSAYLPDLEYVPFIDMGEIWTPELGAAGLNIGRPSVTPGFGVRYFSPVGPIQLNAGYNPQRPQAGPAYYPAPVDSPIALNAPLLCVTAPGTPVVPYVVHGGELAANNATCPATFVPARSSNFFRQFVVTFSINTSF